jgi:CRISPR-associated protein Cas2
MFTIVSYDIPETRRRTKLAKVLLDYGTRVQYSVFECILDAGTLAELTEKINKVIDEKEDKVRIYSLCGNCERAIAVIGQGKVTEDKDFYIV